MPFNARIRLGALALGDVAALIALRPQPAIVHRLATLPAWLDAAGPDKVAAEVASAAMWLAALWLAVGLAAGLGASLPGAAGRVADLLARATLPRAVYALAAAATGVGVLLAGSGAQAAVHRAPTHSALAAPGWPTDASMRAPRWPTLMPDRPVRPVQRPARRPADVRPAAATVVVRPGDSLWRIAAAHLPGRPADGRIATSWPRWYAANRRVIGPDPDVITPGEVLHAPHPTSTHEGRS